MPLEITERSEGVGKVEHGSLIKLNPNLMFAPVGEERGARSPSLFTTGQSTETARCCDHSDQAAA